MLQHPALAPGLARRDPARAFLYRQLTSLGPPAPLAIPILLRETRHPLDALAGLDAPLLFLVGDGGAIFPPALIRELAARLPGAQTLEIAGAGHSPYFEQPESWNRAVLEFLSGVR
jgi:pimeloyl-ACP methyl ester carboxylesterase